MQKASAPWPLRVGIAARARATLLQSLQEPDQRGAALLELAININAHEGLVPSHRDLGSPYAEWLEVAPIVYTSHMSMQQPLHTDRPRTSMFFLISPAIAAVLLVIGILRGDPFAIALAALLLLYVYFTRHAQYDIYLDSLVIRYGRPRRKVIPIDDIADVQLATLPLGGGQGLLIRRQTGGPMVIRPSDPETFASRLEDARRGRGR